MLESEKQLRVRGDISEGEAWLEYIFGICKPDRRVGKLGSRCVAVCCCVLLCMRTFWLGTVTKEERERERERERKIE